jgi:DNA-binding NarL/FixJ family response regulator
MGNTKFIALSMFGERSYIKDMLQAGVSGYIFKNTGREELVKAITMVSKVSSILVKKWRMP